MQMPRQIPAETVKGEPLLIGVLAVFAHGVQLRPVQLAEQIDQRALLKGKALTTLALFHKGFHPASGRDQRGRAIAEGFKHNKRQSLPPGGDDQRISRFVITVDLVRFDPTVMGHAVRQGGHGPVPHRSANQMQPQDRIALPGAGEGRKQNIQSFLVVKTTDEEKVNLVNCPSSEQIASGLRIGRANGVFHNYMPAPIAQPSGCRCIRLRDIHDQIGKPAQVAFNGPDQSRLPAFRLLRVDGPAMGTIDRRSPVPCQAQNQKRQQREGAVEKIQIGFDPPSFSQKDLNQVGKGWGTALFSSKGDDLRRLAQYVAIGVGKKDYWLYAMPVQCCQVLLIAPHSAKGSFANAQKRQMIIFGRTICAFVRHVSRIIWLNFPAFHV